MKNYLYTAREVIEFFDKKLHLKMSESNFTKHKKAKIFKIYKKEGKKGDFYKLPESVINYFDNVIQRSSKGLEAQDRLEAYLKEYKVKEELENKINEQWNKVIKFPKLDVKMFDIKNIFKEEEDELKSEEELMEDFKKNIDQYNIRNLEISNFSVKLMKKSVGEYPNINHTIFQHDMIEFMANNIVRPKEVEKRFNVDFINGIKIEYLNFYDLWCIGDHGNIEILLY